MPTGSCDAYQFLAGSRVEKEKVESAIEYIYIYICLIRFFSFLQKVLVGGVGIVVQTVGMYRKYSSEETRISS